MLGVELGDNGRWLLNSHLSGGARRDGLHVEARIEALLTFREQLARALGEVEQELQALAPVLNGGRPVPLPAGSVLRACL